MAIFNLAPADRLLVQAAWQERRWVALAVLSALAGAAAGLLRPAALAGATDAVLGRSDSTTALRWFAAAVAATVLTQVVSELAEAYSGTGAAAFLRKALVRHVLTLGLAGERRHAAGDLVSRIVAGAPDAASATRAVATTAVTTAYWVGALVALWLIDWRLAATFGLGLPAGVLVSRAFVRQASTLQARYQQLQGMISSRLFDALAGIRTIRAAGTGPREVDRVLSPVAQLAESGHAMWRAISRMTRQQVVFAPLLEIAVLGMAGVGVAQGRISPGQLLAVVGYVGLGMSYLGQASAMAAVARARAGARRLTQILDEPPMAYGTRLLPPGPGELVLRGVGVRGNSRYLLDRLDLTVPAGTRVAVVGRSGAGKSTLAAVAGRLIDPDKGLVLLDGVPVASLRARELRTAITYAFARPTLHGTTVAEAIGYGADVSPSEIRLAAQAVAADAFIRLLPEGYRTPITHAPMSGGEAQRLGLARAVVRGGRILILDDATSSLDTVTEAHIDTALATALPGRTRIVIAHRAATAARADLVAWLAEGKLRAFAPHHVLWADADYRALFATAAPGLGDPRAKDPTIRTGGFGGGRDG